MVATTKKSVPTLPPLEVDRLEGDPIPGKNMGPGTRQEVTSYTSPVNRQTGVKTWA